VLEIDIHCAKRSTGSFIHFPSDHWMQEPQPFPDWSHLWKLVGFQTLCHVA
jgi:hypothetical protein